MSRTRTLLTLTGAALALVLIGLPIGATLYGNYQWFAALDVAGVFTTILGARIALGVTGFTVAFLVLYGSYRWTIRTIRQETEPYLGRQLPLLVIGVVAAYLGAAMNGLWPFVLRFLHATPFGVTDPVFGHDLAFYVFTLPVYRFGLGYGLALVALAGVTALTLYAIHFGFSSREEVLQTEWGPHTVSGTGFDVLGFVEKTMAHGYTLLSVYAGLFLLLLAGATYLSRYGLLYSERGAVYGMGYTDQVVHLPLLTVIAVGLGILGVFTVVNARLHRHRILVGAAVLLGVVFVLGNVAGGLVQGYVVQPDEFNKERPFLTAEINHTRDAFGLNAIETEQFPVSDTLTQATLDANPGTVSNIRLWDWRPLLTTYNELQIFRTYYTFADVDIDRYALNGTTRQVMTAPREIDVSALPEQSQSWVNRHLVYTHGYGVTMSPVRAVTDEGLPNLLIKDIPPRSSVDVTVDEPRIYYGELTRDYAITDTRTRELDYPSGDRNVYTTYTGGGGVPLDSLLDRVVYAVMFGDLEILFSDSLTMDSDLLFHRSIRERAARIAPFLRFDGDPYVAVADGKLYWILDAYTTTDRYPYARPTRFHGEDVNYVRNSVKVVVDAYTGETTFYTAEDEPLVATYEAAFPDLFQPLDTMPAALQDNVRYPEDLFNVQSEQYLTYHMQDPQVFYNKEDAWRVPDEIYRGDKQRMQPYYVMMKLPGEDTAEFVMIRPFIPRGKENMIGWLAARSDPPHYGSLKAFQFSKQELVFGPMQIESRIDQDTEISQRITLWSQSGSEVLRGNLLAIPIDDTIMYVEPLFLQSREAGALPELQRVIVAHGDKLTMQPTLEQALAVIVGEQAPTPPPDDGSPTSERLDRARTIYNEARAALRADNLTRYAQLIDELGTTLSTTGNQTAN